MSEFDLGSFLAEAVSDLDTGHEMIQYIPRGQIHEDPNNFYSMDGLESLASNIALCGLMDPIRIRSVEDGYTIVSGHRRFAAMGLLVADGDKRFALVPSIVEQSELSPAMQELRLIYANNDTRKMSSADQAKQVERVTELLYMLQEEGYSFPGRMRDHVAEACNLSKSKIARLNVIRKGLASSPRSLYETNKINESVAYALASMPKDWQDLIVQVLQRHDRSLSEWKVKDFCNYIERITKIPCPKCDGKNCTSLALKLDKKAEDQWNYNRCEYTCCMDCASFGSCKYACTICPTERQKALEEYKAERVATRERNKAEKEAAASKEEALKMRHTSLYENISRLLLSAGVTPEAVAETIKYPYRRRTVVDRLNGSVSDIHHNDSILDLGISLDEMDCAIRMADILGVSLDELFMHTPVNTQPAPAQLPASAAWQTGEPTELGAYVARIRISEDNEMLRMAYLLPYHQEFSMSSYRFAPIEVPVLQWLKLPEVKA